MRPIRPRDAVCVILATLLICLFMACTIPARPQILPLPRPVPDDSPHRRRILPLFREEPAAAPVPVPAQPEPDQERA